jgi:hypothetical protein
LLKINLDMNVGRNSFLARIIKTQQKLGYKIFTNPGEINIVYVEGCDLDGTLNNDKMNEWNDVRICYQFVNGTPEILGKWDATTEPGLKYTLDPLNPDGAFRIAFGQYKAWVVGDHKGHEALVQLWEPGEKLDNGLRVGELKGFRDKNKDGFRTGDKTVVGTGWGVNQHWGYDMSRVDGASAGCLVGQSKIGHREFIAIVKKDIRYVGDCGYVFWSTILDGSKLESLEQEKTATVAEAKIPK